MAHKPAPADAAKRPRKGEFVMIAEFGAQPGGGIAEAFANVASPCRSAPADIATRELMLAPFGAPTQFAGTTASEFGLEDAFPAPTGLI